MKLDKILKLDNILEELTDKEKDDLQAEVQGCVKDDCSEHEKRIKIYKDIKKTSKAQVDEPVKEFPWENASNVKYPLILSEANAISSMLSTAILQDDIVRGEVVGKDEVEVIDEQSEDGTNTQPLGKQERADRVAGYTNHLLKYVIPSWEEGEDSLLTRLALMGSQFKKTYYDPIEKVVKSELVNFEEIIIADAVSLEESPRITHKFESTRSEVVGRTRAGLYSEVDLEEEQDKFEICETHFYYDLDDDGIKEPYILTHLTDGELLSLQKRFDEEMITYNKKGEVVAIEAELNFTKYGFIKDSDSLIYDIGFGQLLMPLNKTINTIVNQLIDAGTLANTSGGIIGGGSGLKSGKSLKIKMGEYKVLNQVSNIKDNIMEISGKEPSPTLYQLLITLSQASKDITSIKNLNPESINPNTPATTTLLMLEQGLNEFKAIYKRIYRSLQEEIRKILYFTKKYGSIADYLDVMDYGQASEEDFIKDGDYVILPANSSNSVTQGQDMMRANAVYSARLDNPLINPKEATTRYLKALKVETPETLMQEPPAPAPDPMAEQQAMLIEAQSQLLASQAVSLQQRDELAKLKEQREFWTAKNKAKNENIKTMTDGVKTIVEVQNIEPDLKDEKKEVREMGGTLSLPEVKPFGE